MKKVYLLIVLILCSSSQNTYYGSYSQGCSPSLQGSLSVQADKTTNYICNGDFETPQVSAVGKLTNIPCWSYTGTGIELVPGKTFSNEITTQSAELEPSKMEGQGISQVFNLTEGTYEIRFEYAAREQSPHLSSFKVYFNDLEIAKIRPHSHQASTIVFKVFGRTGLNSLEFVDAGIADGKGALIDNVGVYGWKRNNIVMKETEAVGAGFPVTASSWLNVEHMDPQLDADESNTGNKYPCWGPLNHKVIGGHWIQVSATEIKLWNSVIIQGRGDNGNHRVTKFKLMYTLDGFYWQEYENGKEFDGAIDRNTKVRHNLQPFHALTVRLVPLAFVHGIFLRWGMTFLNS